MHSPFVFEFITKVKNDASNYPEFAEIELLRKELRQNRKIIHVEDMGAGSVKGNQLNRTISSIAKNAAKSPKLAQLLFRIARYYKPSNIIELGTSLGISTSYLAKGNPNAKVITMEGAREVAAIAERNFELLKISNVEIVHGNFDNTLENVLQSCGKTDLIYIDGNHRREPTVRYFNQILPFTHNDSIVIFDDIHWSKEMEEAWEEVRNHEAVRGSIDMFYLGIVFFRAEFLEKRHFKILL